MLVYVHKITPRLKYICDFIFDQYFGIPYSFTSDSNSFSEFNGSKLNYSTSSIRCRYTIRPVQLLFQTTLEQQDVACFENGGHKGFFKTADSEFAFDVLAASFYLLSRYEEQLPHTTDMYGRYAHENSLAFKEEFLQLPLVNIWLAKFQDSLQKTFPELVFRQHSFHFLPTYDIDIAWAYKSKGVLRNVGGLMLKPSLKRIRVLQGKDKDPYDCYDFLNALHRQFNLKPLYFFLVASTRGRYDKNCDITGEAFKRLIKEHADNYTVGIHPSWISNESNRLLLSEKKYLEKYVGRNILSSRQHYLKFNVKQTFRNLIKAGIKHEYSMGYGTSNGFRASIASSFYWYDLENEMQTDLQLHPFCFMDATSAFQKKMPATEAYAELLYYYSVCKELNANFITIFHNNILGGGEKFEEWPAMYERFVSVVSNNSDQP